MCAVEPRITRYVAIGDSSTEGLDDARPDGSYRGWSERLADRIARVEGRLGYANFAVRGKRTREVRDEQLAPALALQPDLVTIFSGTNDLIAPRFEPRALARDFTAMFAAARDAGARVLTFTLPDLTPVMPVARVLRGRVAQLDDAIRSAAAATGATCVDLAVLPVAVDARLWSDDRIHANAAGHARIAAALAEALALPGSDASWAAPLAPMRALSRRETLEREWRWWRGHLLPWFAMAVRGARASDGRRPKRPQLEEFAWR